MAKEKRVRRAAESNVEMAKPLIFNREASRVGKFIMVCKRMRRAIVEE